ncbi:phosphatidate cytidylyltransferase [Niallia sp. 03190]|uniref:phosphatidate cytidylyltransferase n=1 Tax=Niallia sp. 03190 TaxID=3458061 RepID=UPI004043F753
MKERIITGIVLAVLFMIPFYFGGYWFTYLTIILAMIAYYELTTIIKIRLFGTKWFVGIIGVILILSPLLIPGLEQIQIKVLLILVLFFITSTVFNEGYSIEKAGTLLIGVLYIAFGFESLGEARIEKGMIWTFSVLLSIWATDSGAYFVGKNFGKRKLAERISPNKTVEGSIGGVIIALIVGIILQLTINPYETLSGAIIITLVVSVAGQVGDLVESALKRHFEVKDSGKLLPGHGGVLDRLDSWIFVFIGLKLIGMV